MASNSSGYGQLQTFAMEAAADLSDRRWHIMRATAQRQINIASEAAHVSMIGVLATTGASGESCSVADSGEGKVIVGQSLGANIFLTTNGSGRAIPAVPASGNQVMVFGRSLEAAASDGEYVTARLFPPFKLGAFE